jgi:hypothetical protein
VLIGTQQQRGVARYAIRHLSCAKYKQT